MAYCTGSTGTVAHTENPTLCTTVTASDSTQERRSVRESEAPGTEGRHRTQPRISIAESTAWHSHREVHSTRGQPGIAVEKVTVSGQLGSEKEDASDYMGTVTVGAAILAPPALVPIQDEAIPGGTQNPTELSEGKGVGVGAHWEKRVQRCERTGLSKGPHTHPHL